MNIGIILAAGSSIRFNKQKPKQFLKFNDKMLLEYSLNTFLNHPKIDKVILVVSKKHFDFCNKKFKNCEIIIGGITRQESSNLALQACPEDTKNVLIHDAARPFVTNELISNCIDELNDHIAVCPGLIVTDTLASTNNRKIVKIIDRTNIYRLQTPQAFNFKVLFDCHNKINKPVTDDISIVINFGYKPKIIDGNTKNMKITYESDLKTIKGIL